MYHQIDSYTERLTMLRLILISCICSLSLWVQAQSADLEFAPSSLAPLLQLRTQVLQADTFTPAQKADSLLSLGAWHWADSLINRQTEGVERMYLEARWAYLHNEFTLSEDKVHRVLAHAPAHLPARLLQAELAIEKWQLTAARGYFSQLLEAPKAQLAAQIGLGRLDILEKKYDTALVRANTLLRAHPQSAGVYRLKGEAHFWLRQTPEAEAAMKKSLELAPYSADTRFAYGYAIWRRVDATLLEEMGKQWELALALNPLHYLTHWHWGNGHTPLTYADYADPNERSIRLALSEADTLLSREQYTEAHEVINTIEQRYPESVIPALYRASALYLSPQPEALASSLAEFLKILAKKPHYGPAHNGVAAAIKKKRFEYLYSYDSLEQVIESTVIEDKKTFAAVFPDIYYYPGERVAKMVWRQLYTSTAYFPMLSRLQKRFVIPPLHIDLALAMKQAFFRRGTTFDNRQWMDIRGVGSGATGIEYVERGAHMERNVTLHEYVHLFHLEVFTDQENRRVRSLYYQAMEEGNIIDYYSANNEYEYLAQTYTAYFIPIKVHPLNHKSVNTRADLQRKDPALYAFLDSLVKKQRAFLAGDPQAMADNWAAVYVNLAERASHNLALKQSHLDSALYWAPKYLPAYIAYADFYRSQKDWQNAKTWIDRAKAVQVDYAPLYLASAQLWLDRYYAGELERPLFLKELRHLYQLADTYEHDYEVKAHINITWRDFYLQQGLLAEAIDVSTSYVAQAPSISTHLRNQKKEMQAFHSFWQAQMGYASESLPFLRELQAQSPQNPRYHRYLVEALMALDQHEEALGLLQQRQRLLKASSSEDPDLNVRIAECYLKLGQQEASQRVLRTLIDGVASLDRDSLLMVRVLADLGHNDYAGEMLAEMKPGPAALDAAEYAFTQAYVNQHKPKFAEKQLEKALEAFPYHIEAGMALLALHLKQENPSAARALAGRLSTLSFLPGPHYQDRLSPYWD